MSDEEQYEPLEHAVSILEKVAADYRALRAENEKLRAALIDTLANLVASVDLLERGGKKAAPSDKMFAQMLVDYKNSIERGRAAAAAIRETNDGNDHKNRPTDPVDNSQRVSLRTLPD